MVLAQPPEVNGEDACARNSMRSRRQRPSAPKKAKSASSARPFRSILKERAFNLQLDVQSMKQGIHNLMMMHDLLNTRIVRQRHEPSGSLMLKIKAYYEAFRLGWAINDGRRRFSRTMPEPREFIKFPFDEEVWVGNAIDVAVLLGGPLMYENSMFGLGESASNARSEGPSSYLATSQYSSPSNNSDAQSSSAPGMRMAFILD